MILAGEDSGAETVASAPSPRGKASLSSGVLAGAGLRFWLLGLAQAAHSIEEMIARLYDFMWVATERLGLARMGMTATTFAVVNMGIITLLLGVAPFVAARRPWAIAVAWIAALVEIANGTGHLAGAVFFRGYVPGAATAPVLILTGAALLLRLRRESQQARAARE